MKIWRTRTRIFFLTLLLLCLVLRPALAVSPLPSNNYPDMLERVLTLPGARLSSDPAENGRILSQQVPVFSIYYVYDRKGGDQGWVQVGRTASAPEGWIAAPQTYPWTLMLVMQYAPPGQRKPVVFFDSHDALAAFVGSSNLPEAAARLFADVDHAAHVVAVEPYGSKTGAVTSDSNFYVLPILSAEAGKLSFNGAEMTMLETASLPSTDAVPPPPPKIRPPRIGMVFVIDTTTSMARYIDLVRQFGQQVAGAALSSPSSAETGIGIIAYRNNIHKTPKLEYLTRIILPLSSHLDEAAVNAAFAQVKEATVSSHSFSEDAFAGIYDGLTQFDWEHYDYRLMLLLTDSGALRGNDPFAEHKGVDGITLATMAREKNIAIVPMHMRTPEAARAHNIEGAEEQYRELGATGDPSQNKYVGIRGGSVEEFRQHLALAASEVDEQIKFAIAHLELKSTPLTTINGAPDIGKLLINEMFAAQMRYIGEQKHTPTPRLLHSWATDHDLGNTGPDGSDTRALDVKIFLTRNQLNDLGLHVKQMLDTIATTDTPEQKVLLQLQSLSTAMSSDPGRFGGQFEKLADTSILPKYLAKLPYKSDVLNLTPESWRSMGPSGRQEFIDRLRFKFTAYHELEGSEANWHDLGAGDRGQKVYAMPLDLLP